MTGCVGNLVNSSQGTENLEYVFCDYTQRLVVASIYTTLSVLGVFGNTLVILAVAMSRKLRSATNIFVTNLSIADLVTSAMFSGHAVAMASPSGWPLPEYEWICSVVSALTIMCLGCTTFTLGFIALNRLLLVTKPVAIYRNAFSSMKVLAMIVCSWLIPAIATLFPPLVFDLVDIGYDNKHKVCTTDHSDSRSNWYDLILAGVYYPIPFLVLTTSYLKIVLHVKRHVKHTNGTLTMSSLRQGTLRSQCNTLSSKSASLSSKHSTLSTIRGTLPPDNHSLSWKFSLSKNHSKLKQNRMQVEITKNTFIVVCAFVMCTTPFTLCVLMDSCDAALPYLGILLLIGSCINPVIYSTRHPQFKRVFQCILSCRFNDIPDPPDWMKAILSKSSTGSSDDNST